MKNIYYLCLLLPILGVANIMDSKGPPQHAILEAEINVLQGKTIYANGQMQAVVRISYVLNIGYKVEEIKIKQFGSGAELSVLGWISSTVDNGYDHNIGSNIQVNYNRKVFEDPKLVINQFYISTNKANEGIELCFEIKTKLSSTIHTRSALTSIYSTCTDESIAQGTDRIFAKRSVIYTGQDFTLLQTQTGIELEVPENPDPDKPDNAGSPDLLGLLYIIYPGPSIPREMKFKLKNETEFFPENYIDSDVKAALKKKKSGNAVYAEYWYAQSVFFTPKRKRANHYVKIFLIDYSASKKAHHVFINSNLFPKALLHIWHVKYSRNTYIVNEMRCKIKIDDSDRVCSWIDDKQTFTVKTERKTSTDIESQEIPDKPSRKIIWIDNYGTEHPIAIVYGFGERELDLDII